MPQSAAEIKERILSFLKANGPSLPIHIAQNIGLSMLFTSAFLSELLSDKELKISYMRIGSSAVHFLPGQEPQLERFSNYLKSKEKEACLILKEKKFLKDSEAEPAIRVALREIRDFAVPFEKNSEIFWRYFTIGESEFREPEKESRGEKPRTEETIPTEKSGKELGTFDSKKERKEVRSKKTATKTAKKASSRTGKPSRKAGDNKFFNKAKDFLAEKGIEILGIEEIGISRIIFRTKENEEILTVAFNKKRVSEGDITKAYKKSKELGLPYKILCLGETPKKIETFINASKSLKSIEKIEYKNRNP